MKNKSHTFTALSRSLRHVLAMLLLAGTAVAGDAMATTYRVVVLPIPADTTLYKSFVGTLSINATGDVTGSLVDDKTAKQYAVEWSPPDYATRVLPASDRAYTMATAINNAGDILGVAWDQNGSRRGNVIWKSDGSIVRLAMTTPIVSGYAQFPAGINANGVVVGLFEGARDLKPEVWVNPRVLRVMTRVSFSSLAYAVNDSGTIVGGAEGAGTSPDHVHGFRWTSDGVLKDLEDLPGGSDVSRAYDVNNSGQIVGSGYSAIGQRAVMWDADASIHDLGNLPNDPGNFQYFANRINNFGDVIGSTTNTGDWLWTAGTGMLPIDSLIDPNDPLHGAGTFTLYGINDAGVLAAGLNLSGGSFIPVLLVPQP